MCVCVCRGDIVQRGAGGSSGLVEEVPGPGAVWVRWAQGHRTMCHPRELRVVGYVQDINIGDIVERGPDWKYGGQDGGPGKRGIVTKFDNNGLVVICQWENGVQAYYRWGSAYDLKVSKSIG